jgi:YVTN family beta-propeller protein
MLALLALLAAFPQALTPEARGGKEPVPSPVLRRQVDPREVSALLQAAFGATPGAPATPPGGLDIRFHTAGGSPEGDAPSGIAFTPDGKRVLVAHAGSRNVIVRDVESGVFVAEIPVSGTPLDIAVTPDGRLAVTPNALEDTLSILDLALGREVAVVPVGNQPGVVAISPDGRTVVVGNTLASNLSIVDLARRVELRRVGGFDFSGTVHIGFQGGTLGVRFTRFVFAGNDTLVFPAIHADRLRILGVAAGGLRSVVVPDQPERVALSKDGRTAVVSCTGADALAIVDVPSATLVRTIPVGANLFGGAIALDPLARKALVSVVSGCHMVELASGRVSPFLETGAAEEIHTSADGRHAFCVGLRGSLVSFAKELVVKKLNGVELLVFGAVSPVAPRAAGVGFVLGEGLLIFDTRGSSGSILHHCGSGPAPEGDGARQLAISADGTRVALCEFLSDSVGIYEADSGSLVHDVEVGDSPYEVAFTPDGSLAVVANLGAPFASVIDVGTGSVTQVPLTAFGGQVEVSPDGEHAYVSTLLDDRVWRIDLAARVVAGPPLETGDMGGIGYPFLQVSGMTLSHDGRTLAVCGTFSDQLTLIDTATWQVVAHVPVASYPVRALFDADDERVFVSAGLAEVVQAVINTGAHSEVVATYATGEAPLDLALSPDEATLYVMNVVGTSVSVLDTRSGLTRATIPLPEGPCGMALSRDGAELYLALGSWMLSFSGDPVLMDRTSGQFMAIRCADFAVLDQVETGVQPAMHAYDAVHHRALAPSPFIDGFYLVELPLRTALGR